jgi:hypothetical protein
MSTAAGDLFKARRDWSLPYLGRRAATLMAVVCLALLILVGILAALMDRRVNSAADWTAQSLQVRPGLLNRLGKRRISGSAGAAMS